MFLRFGSVRFGSVTSSDSESRAARTKPSRRTVPRTVRKTALEIRARNETKDCLPFCTGRYQRELVRIQSTLYTAAAVRIYTGISCIVFGYRNEKSFGTISAEKVDKRQR